MQSPQQFGKRSRPSPKSTPTADKISSGWKEFGNVFPQNAIDVESHGNESTLEVYASYGILQTNPLAAGSNRSVRSDASLLTRARSAMRSEKIFGGSPFGPFHCRWDLASYRVSRARECNHQLDAMTTKRCMQRAPNKRHERRTISAFTSLYCATLLLQGSKAP